MNSPLRLICFLSLGLFCSLAQSRILAIPIEWVDNLDGDFSFASRKCHIQAEGWCYDYQFEKQVELDYLSPGIADFRVNFVSVTGGMGFLVKNDSIISGPNISIITKQPKQLIKLEFSDGFLRIDKTLWQQNVMKAQFEFNFTNASDGVKVYWKGRIYRKIRPWK